MADNSALGATVSRLAEPGMITLRCDLGSEPLAQVLEDITGCPIPETRRIVFAGQIGVAWMSPDELMLFCSGQAAPAIAARLETALAKEHALVLDVSDAREIFRVDGPSAREVIAKGAPVDLAYEAFGVGDFRRTRIGQVAAAIWMPVPERLELMCFRSVADYMAQWLDTSTRDAAFPGILGPAKPSIDAQSA